MFYHVFKKTFTLRSGKVVSKWYYWWKDPVTLQQHQKSCIGSKTRADAYTYVSKLEVPDFHKKSRVKDICRDMFLPESDHVRRLTLMGKNLSKYTLKNHRNFINKIVEQFGNYYLKDLTVPVVNGYLISITDRSGSWKNSFLETLGFVYKEAQWLNNETIVKPDFPRFARNSKKADIFTSEEIKQFFDGGNWTDGLREYLFFLCIASCGLRLGEARALRVCQFIPEKHALVIDGFCERDGTRTNYNKKGSNEDPKLRVTLVPEETLNAVMDYIKKNDLHDEDFVFQREDGTPLRQEFVKKVFNRVLIKSGIDSTGRKLCPHSFRFTYVTRMRRNTDAETVQKLVGHSSVEMTEYYTRASIPDMVISVEDALPAVNQLFS